MRSKNVKTFHNDPVRRSTGGISFARQDPHWDTVGGTPHFSGIYRAAESAITYSHGVR